MFVIRRLEHLFSSGDSCMSTSAEKLRATLADLHGQLEAVEELDPEVRQMLRGALDEIHEKLDHSEAESEASANHESTAQNLRELVDRFEGSHPTLAGAVGSVIDALGRMGI